MDGNLDTNQQTAMEQEVMRLLALPPEEVERQFQQELGFMAPTSKAPSFAQVPPLPVMTSGPIAVPKTPPTRSPPPARPSPRCHRQHQGQKDRIQGCRHLNISRRGTNAYVDMETCKDCGAVIKKEKKETTARDAPMPNPDPNCQHLSVDWKGTNGYSWRWTCKDCGKVESVRKEPGRAKPIPGSPSPSVGAYHGGANVNTPPAASSVANATTFTPGRGDGLMDTAIARSVGRMAGPRDHDQPIGDSAHPHP